MVLIPISEPPPPPSKMTYSVTLVTYSVTLGVPFWLNDRLKQVIDSTSLRLYL